MIVKVHEHKVEIIKTPVNEKEVNVTKCTFQFDEIIPNNYVKKAFFTLNGNAYEQIIVNNECDIPNEVLLKKGSIELGVVAYKVENEELIQRFNPSPDYFDSWSGSLKQATNTEPITPTDKEQIEQQLNNISTQMDNLDIEAEKVEHTTTITITKKDGTTETTEILDGNGISTITAQESQLDDGNNVITITDTNGETYTFNVKNGSKGSTGEPGAIKFLIVQTLPTQDIQTDAIYLVPITPDKEDNNYAEYIYVNGEWEELGKIGVHIDLSNYYTKQETYSKTETNTLLNGKANTSDIPTTTSQLTNNSGFITNAVNNLVNYYTKTEIDNTIGNINSALDSINGEVI